MPAPRAESWSWLDHNNTVHFVLSPSELSTQYFSDITAHNRFSVSVDRLRRRTITQERYLTPTTVNWTPEEGPGVSRTWPECPRRMWGVWEAVSCGAQSAVQPYSQLYSCPVTADPDLGQWPGTQCIAGGHQLHHHQQHQQQQQQHQQLFLNNISQLQTSHLLTSWVPHHYRPSEGRVRHCMMMVTLRQWRDRLYHLMLVRGCRLECSMPPLLPQLDCLAYSHHHPHAFICWEIRIRLKSYWIGQSSAELFCGRKSFGKKNLLCLIANVVYYKKLHCLAFLLQILHQASTLQGFC